MDVVLPDSCPVTPEWDSSLAKHLPPLLQPSALVTRGRRPPRIMPQQRREALLVLGRRIRPR
jgi:hypothetical protein